MIEWKIIDVSKLDVTSEILERTKITDPILLTHPVPKAFTDLFGVKIKLDELMKLPEAPND